MILLVGGGGIPNYGDELIISNWLRWYGESAYDQCKRVVVEGYNSTVLRNTLADRYPSAEWSHTVKNARLKFRDLDFWGALEGGLSSASNSADAVRRSFASARSASLIHIYGGGYINETWPSHAFVLGLGSAANTSAGVRAVATGIGIGPLSKPDRRERNLLDQALDSFEFVEVRDSWSWKFLKSNLSGSRADKVVLGLDDAFLYPVDSSSATHRTLHLALRDGPVAESIIERLTPKFVRSFDRHRYWMCHPASDAGAYVKLVKLFRQFELSGPSHLLEDLHLSPQDVLLTERFHPHLQAARVGLTGVFWSGSEYYDTKHGSILDLGSAFTRDDGQEFAVENFSKHPATMASRDGELVSRKQALAQHLLGLL